MLVTTTKGEMDDSLLEKREDVVERRNEQGVLLSTAYGTEYWLDGEKIHRSVHVVMTKEGMPPGMISVLARLVG